LFDGFDDDNNDAEKANTQKASEEMTVNIPVSLLKRLMADSNDMDAVMDANDLLK